MNPPEEMPDTVTVLGSTLNALSGGAAWPWELETIVKAEITHMINLRIKECGTM